MRNIDKIKNMTLDEIAELFSKRRCYCIHDSYCDGSLDNEKICQHGIKQWLQQEQTNEWNGSNDEDFDESVTELY